MPTSLEYKVKHEVVKHKGKILFRHFKDLPDECFKIRLYVEGDLRRLERVEYELHPSFDKPLQSVKKSRGGFPIEIWTWGEFDILVTFYFKNGEAQDTVYSLAYSKELPEDEDEYIDVTPDYLRRA